MNETFECTSCHRTLEISVREPEGICGECWDIANDTSPIDYDPVCVCGTYQSEHALCGCGDFQAFKKG